MRVSEKFGLGVSQGSLDFVDVNVSGDTPVFVDPKAIRLQTGEWADSCQGLLQSFFNELLTAIKQNDKPKIASLILHTSEPNETHLGVSIGQAKGRGVGSGKKASLIVEALSNSSAAKTGLLEDLEDTVLFIPTIGRDTISDITTNIIRGPLIEYTQQMCKLFEIPMEEQYSGPVWDDETKTWAETDVLLPRANGGKLLLVPKSIVRINLMLDADKYYRDYIRPYFVDIELNDPSSQLVYTLKDGRRKVTVGKLDKIVGTSKTDLVSHTIAFPDALSRYKKSFSAKSNPPLTNEKFEDILGTERVDYQALLASVKAIAPGAAGATSYHRAVAHTLSALFDGSLGNQQIEHPLHEGRKRLDIVMDNIANQGLFWLLGSHYHAATIPIECKNYSTKIKNEELDQLTGRFSPLRGKVGILVCRHIEDKEKMALRCRDAAKDDRGLVFTLDDDDLQELVVYADANYGKSDSLKYAYPLLRKQYDFLVS